MRDNILNVKNHALAEILDAKSVDEVKEIKLRYLGRKGQINKMLKELLSEDKTDKKKVGTLINDTKKSIQDAIDDTIEKLIEKKTQSSQWFDLSIPAKEPSIGYYHPQTKVLNEVFQIFKFLGYQIAEGPEIETDYYNFEALNFPKDHPARDSQQTMFIDTDKSGIKSGQLLPRTHTSAMQGRIMEENKPPFKVIVPGKCYRYEQVDASHGVEFWQVEGFSVSEKITFSNLLATLDVVLKMIFGKKTKIKFAATYFPFVEPGVDAYIQCTVCSGKGCSFCKRSGWSEIIPAGMIHPNVLKKSGINPDKYSGFAFGIGLSRIVTLKYKIDDLRILNSKNPKILKQFKY